MITNPENRINGNMGFNIPFNTAESQKEEIVVPKDPEDIVSFARKGMEEMESAGYSGKAVETGEKYLEVIARKNRGNNYSRLAQIALKAVTEGDSILADLSGMTRNENMASMPANFDSMVGSNPVLAQTLYGNTSAVLKSALSVVASGMTGPVSVLSATAGLKAMEETRNFANPTSPGLAGEPFIMGIAENSPEESNAGKLTDFLTDEMNPMLPYASHASYRVALESIKNGSQEHHIKTLAKMGLAIKDEIPSDKEKFYGITNLVAEQISDADLPVISDTVSEIQDQAESLARDEDFKGAFNLIDSAFSSIESAGSAIDFSKNIINSMAEPEKSIPLTAQNEVGVALLDELSEAFEGERSLNGLIARIASEVVESEEDDGRKQTVLRAVAQMLNPDEKPEDFNFEGFVNIGKSLMDTMKTLNADDSLTAGAGRAFLGILESEVGEFPDEVSSAIQSALECEPEDKTALEKCYSAINSITDAIAQPMDQDNEPA